MCRYQSDAGHNWSSPDVLEDPSFKILTAEATEARDGALNLSAWQKDPRKNLRDFLVKFVKT